MTTHVLVESLAHAEQARRVLEGPIHWHATSPVVIERLSDGGDGVTWADEAVPAAWSTDVGLACRAAVMALEPEFQRVADDLGSRRLVPFVSQTLAFFLGMLCYKRAILEAFAKPGGARAVIGTPGLTVTGGGRIGIGSFDTVFRNITEGLDLQLIDGEPFDQSVLEQDFDRGTVSDRVLSLLDLSRGQITSRRLRFLKASRIGSKTAKGTVFVGRDNDTIREMLPRFLDRGYAIARLPRPARAAAGEPEPGLPTESRLKEALEQGCRAYGVELDASVPASLAAAQMADASRYWRGAKSAAEASVEAMSRGDAKGGPATVITNTIGDLAGAFQADAAEAAGIPTVIVEHGVSAGLSCYHVPIRVWSEPIHGAAYLACADGASLFFKEEERLESVAFHTIGLADQTRRVPLAWLQRILARWRFKPSGKDRIIVYLARASQNNFRKLSHAPRDCDLYRLQRTMCRDVMGRLRGRAVVKLYSTRRYIDGDAFWDNARAPEPVITIKTGDFRYFRAGVDVIILESPLSTVGWVFGTGKPVVYLADPGTPLLPDVREALAEAVFLVDLAEPDWGDRVVEIVNQPDADLTAAWRAKEPARRSFLQSHVLGPENPGRRGADAVIDTLESAA